MAGDNRTDAERAEQRAAREAREAAKGKAKADKAKKPADKSSDPVLDGAEMLTTHGKRIKVTDEEFAVMLEKAGGFKSRVAQQLGVSTSAICHRIKRSKYLTETCLTIEERILDLAEASLIKAAQNGEPWAVQFILKCKGRKRGWIERQDIAFGGDPEALPPPIVIGVHDAAFVERERKRQERDFAEIVDAAVVELKPDGMYETAAEGAEYPSTSGAVAQHTDAVPEDGAEFPGVGGAEPAAVAPGPAEPRPHDGGGTIARPDDAARQRANNAQRPAAATPPPKPRTPSEAARMRREQEARERSSGGAESAGGREAARPAFARPGPGSAGRGMRGGGFF